MGMESENKNGKKIRKVYRMKERLCKFILRMKQEKQSILKALIILRYGLFILGVLGFTICIINKSLDAAFFFILIILLSNVEYGFLNISRRAAYLLFLASFFCFLLGRMTVDFVSNGSVRFYFSESIAIHMLVSIALSLIFIQVGYEAFEVFIEKKKISPKDNDSIGNSQYIQKLRKYSAILFYISAIMAIAMNIEQIIFIKTKSYLDLYTSFSSHIPRVFQIVGNMHIVAFLVYLATRPKKKKCILPMLVFAVIAVSVMIAGDRGTFIIDIAVVIVYIFWRQYMDKEVWISRRMIIVGLICIPFVAAFLSYSVYLREGVDIGEKSISNQFARFFKSTGNSVDILGYGKQYEDKFPQSFYSLGELIDYAKYNPISEIIIGEKKPIQHTEEYAMTMHSYAHTISYFINSESYLSGHGKGSSYIAEVYNDFGYMGIIVCNLAYGVLLALINVLPKSKPILISILLIALRILLYTPRGPMIVPISYFINITTIFALMFLWGMSKYAGTLYTKIKSVIYRKDDK